MLSVIRFQIRFILHPCTSEFLRKIIGITLPGPRETGTTGRRTGRTAGTTGSAATGE